MASMRIAAWILCCLLSSLPPQALSMTFVKQQVNRQVLMIHRSSLSRDNGSLPIANLTLYFFPETAYNIREEETVNVSFTYSLQSAVDLNATFQLEEDRVARLLNSNFLLVANSSVDEALTAAAAAGAGNSTVSWNGTYSGQLPNTVQLLGTFLGRSDLRLLISDPEDSQRFIDSELRYRVSVIRKRRPIDNIVQVAIFAFVILANVGMGCELDMRVIKKVLKKPVAPVLGFVSQYVFMPLVSFAILHIIDLPASTALGYFGMGCAPGGGASNFYCLLLGGDISLSITMTLISTLAALGVTSLYMLTLGQYILRSRNVDIQIPYLNIVLSLLLILIPTGLGYIIKLKLPRVAKVFRKILKPAVLVFIVFMFTVGVYANLFIWQLFNPAIIAAGCTLPYAGFILGGILAAIFRQPWPYVKTVSLETGIQNPGVPILILQTSLPQPDSDLSLVGPFAAATFTPMPLFVWVAGRFIYYRCYLKRSMFAQPEIDAEIDMDAAAASEAAAKVVDEDKEVEEESGPFIDGPDRKEKI
ncbi:hypothetical protein BOX15_Mlig008455g1 [Macrostomum lignano]|uniref:Ileal sodium/bile acid cotransporter n=2 Tax=Macrostomum lignano TaxID=282301 RepID=A0A1I8GJA6_9PLAT|nr:hypothetical protein BOX15_Mlig008455g1 [Macrostomum lignano]